MSACTYNLNFSLWSAPRKTLHFSISFAHYLFDAIWMWKTLLCLFENHKIVQLVRKQQWMKFRRIADEWKNRNEILGNGLSNDALEQMQRSDFADFHMNNVVAGRLQKEVLNKTISRCNCNKCNRFNLYHTNAAEARGQYNSCSRVHDKHSKAKWTQCWDLSVSSRSRPHSPKDKGNSARTQRTECNRVNEPPAWLTSRCSTIINIINIGEMHREDGVRFSSFSVSIRFVLCLVRSTRISSCAYNVRRLQ